MFYFMYSNIPHYYFPGKPILTYDKAINNQTLKAGHSLVLNVNIEATPAAKVTWFHNDKQISQSGTVSIETEDTFSRLTFKGVTGKNTGTYRIEAENKVGKASEDLKATVIGKIKKLFKVFIIQ